MAKTSMKIKQQRPAKFSTRRSYIVPLRERARTRFP